jgi:ribosome-associated protein YbcJ (S4-like RNA binding protein)
MNKKRLNRFINKYYLNGTVNSVVLNSKSNSQQLSARFVSGDKSLLGELVMDKWSFEDSDIGIYNTEQLVKLLSVVDEDINLSLTRAGDKSIALKISDSSSSVNYMLTDTSVINEPPTLKSIPEFELSIDVTPQFINKFIAGKGALGETDNFTIINDGGSIKAVIGHSSVNTNRVTIPVTTTKVSDIDNVTFNANIFKEVLSANKECESATLEVSSEGLSRITFKIDDYTSTYYLVAVQDVD